jgi:hypothetical protein
VIEPVAVQAVMMRSSLLHAPFETMPAQVSRTKAGKRTIAMLTRTATLVVLLLAVTSMFAQENVPERRLGLIAEAETANQIPKFTGTPGILTDSIMAEVSGKIGINTTDPKTLLHLFAGATSDVFAGMGTDPGPSGPAMNFGYSGATFGRGSGFFNVRPDALAVAPNPSLRFMTIGSLRMIITNSGKVGIGVIPAAASTNILEVAGNANFTGTVTGNNIAATYQDVAEWVSASSDLAPGTVVVLNPDTNDAVIPSGRGYDSTVAGVVSAQPGLILGIREEGKEAIATTGRVKVRVDARNHPIRIGDLLVTSDVPGTAMRSEPIEIKGRTFHQPGTIIGKALEPLKDGVGEILVLLSLQ